MSAAAKNLTRVLKIVVLAILVLALVIGAFVTYLVLVTLSLTQKH